MCHLWSCGLVQKLHFAFSFKLLPKNQDLKQGGVCGTHAEIRTQECASLEASNRLFWVGNSSIPFQRPAHQEKKAKEEGPSCERVVL